MNIKDWIILKEVPMIEERAKRLEEIRAPKIMIEGTIKMAQELKEGNLKIGGDKSLLEEEATDYEVKNGRGGVSYIQFDNGIAYFPNAKYGRFISKK